MARTCGHEPRHLFILLPLAFSRCSRCRARRHPSRTDDPIRSTRERRTAYDAALRHDRMLGAVGLRRSAFTRSRFRSSTPSLRHWALAHHDDRPKYIRWFATKASNGNHSEQFEQRLCVGPRTPSRLAPTLRVWSSSRIARRGLRASVFSMVPLPRCVKVETGQSNEVGQGHRPRAPPAGLGG